MPSKRPKLIVITPVRNEAWVLDAWLRCTSAWADHIIIADQHSTDGSRELATRYPKVTLIDNPCEEWVEYRVRTALLEEAQRIEGDKIIFGLDADEFFEWGFDKTNDWQRILQSTPNEIFFLHWLNVYGDFNHVVDLAVNGEWIGHFGADVDIVEEYRKREHHSVHCSRIPSLDASQCRYTPIKDFRLVHLGALSSQRVYNKLRFYTVVYVDKNPEPWRANPVSAYRAMHNACPAEVQVMDTPVKLYRIGDGDDQRRYMKETDPGQHYIDEIQAILQRRGKEYFAYLPIYEPPLVPPKRKLVVRIIHKYLQVSQPYSHTAMVKTIDKAMRHILPLYAPFRK